MKTPEAAVNAFLTGWRRRDWKAMNRAVQTRRVVGKRSTPQRLAALFGDKVLSSWELLDRRTVSTARIVAVNGKRYGLTPDAEEVRVRAVYRIGGVLFRRVLALNVVLEDETGNPPVEPGTGSWGVNETSALRESVDSADAGTEDPAGATG